MLTLRNNFNHLLNKILCRKPAHISLFNVSSTRTPTIPSKAATCLSASCHRLRQAETEPVLCCLPYRPSPPTLQSISRGVRLVWWMAYLHTLYILPLPSSSPLTALLIMSSFFWLNLYWCSWGCKPFHTLQSQSKWWKVRLTAVFISDKCPCRWEKFVLSMDDAKDQHLFLAGLLDN